MLHRKLAAAAAAFFFFFNSFERLPADPDGALANWYPAREGAGFFIRELLCIHIVLKAPPLCSYK